MSSDPPAKSPWIVETTDASFTHDVIERSRTVPVVVDFWAPWCQPCRMLAPILEQFAAEYAGRFWLVKANTEEVLQATAEFRVDVLPTVFGVRDGQPVDYFTGLLPPQSIRAWLENLFPTQSETLVAEAGKLAAIDPAAAEAKYCEAVDLAPQAPAPKLALANFLLAAGRLEESRQLVADLESVGFNDAEVAKIRAAIELRQRGDGGGNVEELRRAATSRTDDLTAQLKLAQALAANPQPTEEQLREALDILLALVERDRYNVGEQARRLMLDIFALLPADAPLVGEFRHKLSLALF